MKFKTILKTALSSAFITLLFIYSGCGEDSTTNNNGTTGGGYHPTLNFTVGQIFVYTTDTLWPNGTVVRKRWKTSHTVLAQTPIGGQNCYPFSGTTFDTTTNQTIPELYYVRYDQSAGKYYQYGLQQLINPGAPLKWDVVADFDAARGTNYNIATINYSVPVPGFGNVPFSGPLTGKIDSTTIQSTNNPSETVPCYHVEMLADVSGTVGGITLTAKIYVDYYIGCVNPIGLVELKSRPFNIIIQGNPNPVQFGGYDRKLKTHTP